MAVADIRYSIHQPSATPATVPELFNRAKKPVLLRDLRWTCATCEMDPEGDYKKFLAVNVTGGYWYDEYWAKIIRPGRRRRCLESVLWGVSGQSWGVLGPSWSHLGTILGPSWALMGCLGASWCHLEPSRSHLGAILRRLGPSWCRLGATWVRLGAILRRLGASLGRSWGRLEPN